ncbi:uncharacterized protein LOC127260455 [Andrographis paniculata]|uniref:uncharacterized protein LOC127260455 n=1 Tax=Andrographis paniculata TaxID=175694 RepID=UPI0021E7964A|nr:uncharacterized protein LOC127260455 [Andrographis paniculata]
MAFQQYVYPYPYMQEFQHFLVIDFEATCDKGKILHPQEIMDFPSQVVCSITGLPITSFQTYVRPTNNPTLTDYCKELTGIQQDQVERELTLDNAILLHDEWLQMMGIKNTNFAVVTWSDWDCRALLETECRVKNIYKPPYFNRWINLRVPFHNIFGGQACKLNEAVEKAGLKWEGRLHCGLDHVKNIARLLALLIHKGYKLSITNMLPYNSSDPAPLCNCGVKSNKSMVRKHGPWQGKFFFGCGNWTPARGAKCQFMKWAIE